MLISKISDFDGDDGFMVTGVCAAEWKQYQVKQFTFIFLLLLKSIFLGIKKMLFVSENHENTEMVDEIDNSFNSNARFAETFVHKCTCIYTLTHTGAFMHVHIHLHTSSISCPHNIEECKGVVRRLCQNLKVL